jgi:hypothetical protein
MKNPESKRTKEDSTVLDFQYFELAVLVVCLIILILMCLIPAGALEVSAVYQGF